MANDLPKNIQDLLTRYGLNYNKDNPKESDIFVSPNYKIVTRSGIEKIQLTEKIVARYEICHKSDSEVVMKGIFYRQDDPNYLIETFGEASIDKVEYFKEEQTITANSDKGTPYVKATSEYKPVVTKKGNVKQSSPYLFALAEKRTLSRGVLKLAGLYKEGFFGEDESDDFSQEVKSQKAKVTFIK